MNKAYNRINNGNGWENYPSDKTPLNKYNLDKEDIALDEIDNRVIMHENTKATKTEVATLVQDIAFDESTGIFTITKKNGAVFILDTKLEKLSVNYTYDKDTQILYIILDDGTKQPVDLSSLISQYEFLDSATVGFQVLPDGKVKAIVLDGSITEDKLRPDYLADIKVEVAKAQASQTAAATSEANAEKFTMAADNFATSAAQSAAQSDASASAAKASENNSGASAAAAKTSETNAGEYAVKASAAEQTATEKADQAGKFAANAGESAELAGTMASKANTSSQQAGNYADLSKSYAVGTDGTVRPGDDIDNALNYYEQVKRISQGLQGALMPMGTITFAQLPSVTAQAGYMYNISDGFTTDETFNEGAGHEYPAGTNVYLTADGKWDCMAGTAVGGVKGAKEATYRQGLVNLTPEEIGALPEDGDSAENTVTFTSADSTTPTGWTNVAQMQSGEKHSSLFNKISTMFKNVRWLYKMLGTTDISAIGGGTVTGAIAAQNEALASKVNNDDSRLSDARTPTAHTHDERYYTEAEVNNLLKNYMKTGLFNLGSSCSRFETSCEVVNGCWCYVMTLGLWDNNGFSQGVRLAISYQSEIQKQWVAAYINHSLSRPWTEI